jgi:hypothetical protein
MRWNALIGLAAVTLAAGCPLDSPGESDSYLLVVDSATLDAASTNAMCASPLEVRVRVTVDGVPNETPVATGLTPQWQAAVVDAPAADYFRGVEITLLGHCDGTTFTIGSLWVHPPTGDIRGGTIFLVAVGPSAVVRMHFELSTVTPVGDNTGVPGGGGDVETPPGDDCSDGSCVWLDPGSPPPDDVEPGDDGSDPGDDGGWSDPGDDGGDCGCGDSGGGDDGGDGGGDGLARPPPIMTHRVTLH